MSLKLTPKEVSELREYFQLRLAISDLNAEIYKLDQEKQRLAIRQQELGHRYGRSGRVFKLDGKIFSAAPPNAPMPSFMEIEIEEAECDPTT